MHPAVSFCVNMVLNCLDDFFETFNMAAGKKMWQVEGVIFAIMGLSIIAEMLELPIICQWYEALPAFIIIGIIACIGTISSADVNKVVGFLKERAEEVKAQSNPAPRRRPKRKEGGVES